MEWAMMVTIHVLHHGRSICRFRDDEPGHWPLGHIWIREDETAETTRACLDPTHPIHVPSRFQVCIGCLTIYVIERRPCVWCDEKLEMDDCYISPSWPDGPAMHRTCLIRSVAGSLAHIEGRCSCKVPGAEETDPPGMTRREAAKAAAAAYRRIHADELDS